MKISKFLSLVLRHQPAKIGLELDAQGWADVDELLRKANQHGVAVTRDLLQQVVAQDDKQRFAFNADGTRLRASQGHSIKIDLGLEPIVPPARLYHGTATRFIESIRRKGLLRSRRDYVHLSADEATARKVGARHGEPIVLGIQAREMHAAGLCFYRSANGVWLTDHVPVEYLDFPAEAS
ncbi:MAG TPA: RNA 2'-phosphotransferase [Anaerolineae bacterium]|nr:RNA 2'-phosphotransferase [Anaerolineae bacterium]